MGSAKRTGQHLGVEGRWTSGRYDQVGKSKETKKWITWVDSRKREKEEEEFVRTITIWTIKKHWINIEECRIRKKVIFEQDGC